MHHTEEQFQLVVKAFERTDHLGSGSLLQSVAAFFENAPDCAYALAAHGSDIQEENDPFDFMNKDWKEIYLEAYRRAFYDVEQAAKYGTEHIANSAHMLKMITVELVQEAIRNDPDNLPMDLTDLPSNVFVFPSTKTRQ